MLSKYHEEHHMVSSISSSGIMGCYDAFLQRAARHMRQNDPAASAHNSSSKAYSAGMPTRESQAEIIKNFHVDIDIEQQTRFSYSTFAPSELAINYSIPSCMGAQLLGSPLDPSFSQKKQSYADDYKLLMEKSAERQEEITKEYGLEDLSREEYYAKTQGEMSQQMTDSFYNGFDEEGKKLISFFFPEIGNKYNF